MAETDVKVAKRPGDVIRHFTAHEADAPLRAMGYNPTQPREVRLFERLRANGTILQASPGLYYVDPAKVAARRTALIGTVLGIGAGAGVLAAGAMVARKRRSPSQHQGAAQGAEQP